MQKILVTGSTDGIGLETAKMLISMGHYVLLHGRNTAKLAQAEKILATLPNGKNTESYIADLSCLEDVELLAKSVSEKHHKLDALINNAGVYSAENTATPNALDVRFAVNTIAPYLLTKQLLPLLGAQGRVINVSSAAQAPVDLKALEEQGHLSDGVAYAQSKLALTMWSRSLALSLKDEGPSIIAVNPKSMLGSKMVKEAYGVTGADLSIGADILTRAALSEEFKHASGKYYDNDIRAFASPHPDALDKQKCEKVVSVIERILNEIKKHSD